MFDSRPAHPDVREKALAAMNSFLAGLDPAKLTYQGHAFFLRQGVAEVYLMASVRAGVPLLGTVGDNGQGLTAPAKAELSNIEKAVIGVCTTHPQTAKKIAALCGYSQSRVRETIAALTSREPPLLIRTSKGIRLP